MKKLFLFILPFFCAAAFAGEARLTRVTGKVYLRPANLPTSEWIEAEQDTPIEEGDTIRTDSGAAAELTLDGETLMLLEENTQLKADTVQSYVSRFFLAVGSLTAKIRKLRSPQEQFSIYTPVAVAAVRGTELAISAQEGEEAPASIAVLDEGQVVVQSEGHPDVVLNPGQETQISKGMAPVAPHPIQRLEINRHRIPHVRERIDHIKPRWQSVPPLKRNEFRARMMAKPRQHPEFKRPAPPATRRELRQQKREDRRQQRREQNHKK